jgi:hypothetical protein
MGICIDRDSAAAHWYDRVYGIKIRGIETVSYPVGSGTYYESWSISCISTEAAEPLTNIPKAPRYGRLYEHASASKGIMS